MKASPASVVGATVIESMSHAIAAASFSVKVRATNRVVAPLVADTEGQDSATPKGKAIPAIT